MSNDESDLAQRRIEREGGVTLGEHEAIAIRRIITVGSVMHHVVVQYGKNVRA